MQDSIEAKLIKLSERLSEIEKQLIEESSTLNPVSYTHLTLPTNREV